MKEEIIALDRLCLAYEKKITEPISLSLAEGEILLLAGESGSGKTSVLRAILGLPELQVRVVSGSIRYRGRELTNLQKAERRALLGREITMIFQNPGASFNPIRSYQKQFVDMQKSQKRYRGKESLAEIRSCLESLNLPDAGRILASCPCELSGGMNQRIAVAAAMLLKPRLLLADEPTSALDENSQEAVAEELLRLRELTGMSMILVTHDLRLAGKLADQIGILREGRLVEYGAADQLLRHPQNAYTKELLAAVPEPLAGMD